MRVTLRSKTKENKDLIMKFMSVIFSGVLLSGYLTGCAAKRYDGHSVLRADQIAANARFLNLITSIEGYLKKHISGEPTPEQALPLALSGIRNDLFKIQNLASIYAERFASISEIQSTSKELEDRVGALRESNEKLDFAIRQNASQEKINQLKNLVESEKRSLASLLSSRKWQPSVSGNIIERYRSIIGSISWDDPSGDRSFLFGAVCRQFMHIDNRDWTMFDLTAPNGLHNLKKEIRWSRLQVGLLTGDVIGENKVSCGYEKDLEAYNTEINEGNRVESICKSSGDLQSINNLENGSICLLSPCYLQRLSTIYDTLSAAKDEAEGLAAIGRQISRERLQLVDDSYQELRRNNILRKLAFELNSCVNKTKK